MTVSEGSAPVTSGARRLLRVGLVFVGLALSLLPLSLLEQRLRAAESESGIVWLPDEPGRKYGLLAKRNTNADGFRGPLRSKEKPPGVFRVVVLGDSLTFGNGVIPEDVWVSQAELALGALGQEVELINLGVYSYDIGQIAATLRHRGWDYDPDLVVYAAYVNDHVPTDTMLVDGAPVYVGDTLGDGVVPFGEELWLAASQRSAIVRRLLGGLSVRRGVPGRQTEWDGGLGFFTEHLDAMAADARAHDVPLLVWSLAPHPLAAAEGCDAPSEFELFCRESLARLRSYHEAFEARGLPHASALPYLRASGERSFYLDANTIRHDANHPNPAGHRIIAAGFLDALERWRSGQPLASLDAEVALHRLPEIEASVPEVRPRKGKGPPRRQR